MRSSEIRYRYEFFAQGEADFDVETWDGFEEIFRRMIPQKMPEPYDELQGAMPTSTHRFDQQILVHIVGDAVPGVPRFG